MEDERKTPDGSLEEGISEEQKAIYRIYSDFVRQAELREQEDKRKTQEIYASYGITLDKVEGVTEYYHAMFKGVAIFETILTLVLVLTDMIAFGVTSTPAVFALLALSVEGGLLSLTKSEYLPIRAVAKSLFPFPSIMAMVLTVCYLLRLGEPAFTYVFAVFLILCAAMTIFCGAIYFRRNPYEGQRRYMKEAKAEIHQMQKDRKKEEQLAKKRSVTQRKKEQKRLRQIEAREQRASERRQLRELAEKLKLPIKKNE